MPDFYITAHGELLPQTFVVQHRKIAFMAQMGCAAYGEPHMGFFGGRYRACLDVPGSAVTFDERVHHIERELGVKLDVFKRGQEVYDISLSGSDEARFSFGVFLLPLCESSSIHADINDNDSLSAVLSKLPLESSVIVSSCRIFGKSWTPERIGEVRARATEGILYPYTRSHNSANAQGPKKEQAEWKVTLNVLRTFSNRLGRLVVEGDGVNGTYDRLRARTRSASGASPRCISFIHEDTHSRLNISMNSISLMIKKARLAVGLNLMYASDHNIMRQHVRNANTITVSIGPMEELKSKIVRTIEVTNDDNAKVLKLIITNQFQRLPLIESEVKNISIDPGC